MADLPNIRPGRTFDWVVQEHLAERAGKHWDLRLGDASTGMLSWAVPKSRLPEKAGQSLLAVEQPVHRYRDRHFQGQRKSGRGKGTVTQKHFGQIKVLSVDSGRIRFSTEYMGAPAEFLLVRGSKSPQSWSLVNVTPPKTGQAPPA